LARRGQRKYSYTRRGRSREVKAAVVLAATLALGIATLLTGCSEKESFSPDLAGGLGSDSLFRSVTLSPVLEMTAKSGESAGNPYESRRLVVCNWRGYRSRCFLRFSALPDTTIEVTKATLFLYATRIQSTTPANVFGLYTLADSLYEETVTWESMPGLDTQVATFSLASPDPATMVADSVTLDVTSLVTSWMMEEGENLGLAVKLEDEVSSDVIVEFASREDQSTREVVAGDDTSDFYVRPVIRIEYTDGDTSYVQSLSTEDTFAAIQLAPLPDSLLACGNGFPSRAFLQFDLGAIPREATVIRADLKLSVDLEASSFDSIAVICHALVDSMTGFASGYGVTGTGSKILWYPEIKNDQSFTMNITALVQPAVSRDVTNRGIFVKSRAEISDLDFVVFDSIMGGQPDKAARLQVEYVLPAAPRYWKD
jgi:hypothetical protein